MKTVRTTFLPDQKNRSVYFDAEETERYFEQERGRVTTERMREYHQNWSFIINAAYNDGYNDGYQDGIVEALERAGEDLQNE